MDRETQLKAHSYYSSIIRVLTAKAALSVSVFR
jgi:hypothetical protein